jgi:hypothetical protein
LACVCQFVPSNTRFKKLPGRIETALALPPIIAPVEIIETTAAPVLKMEICCPVVEPALFSVIRIPAIAFITLVLAAITVLLRDTFIVGRFHRLKVEVFKADILFSPEITKTGTVSGLG